MIRLFAFLWVITHAVLTACGAIAIIMPFQYFTPSEQIVLYTGVMLWWVTLVWATLIVSRKRI